MRTSVNDINPAEIKLERIKSDSSKMRLPAKKLGN